MKKLAKNIAIFSLVIIGCFSFVACGKNKNDEKYEITTSQAEILLSKMCTEINNFTSNYNNKNMFQNENFNLRYKNALCKNLNSSVYFKDILDLIPNDKVELGRVYRYQTSTITKFYRIKQELNKKVFIDEISYKDENNIECYSFTLEVEKGDLKSLNLKTFASSQGTLTNIEITEFNLDFDTYECNACLAQPINVSSNIPNVDFLEVFLNSDNISRVEWMMLYGFEINPNKSVSDMVTEFSDEKVKQKVLNADYEKFYDLKLVFETTSGMINLESDIFKTAETSFDKIVYDETINKFTIEENL